MGENFFGDDQIVRGGRYDGPLFGKAATDENAKKEPFATIVAGPFDVRGRSVFSELWREGIKGYSRGQIIVSANGIAPPGSAYPNTLYQAEINIVGFIAGQRSVLARGAVGQQLTLRDSEGQVFDMGQTPLQYAWQDGEIWTEIGIEARHMRGGLAYGTVDANGKLDVSAVLEVWR